MKKYIFVLFVLFGTSFLTLAQTGRREKKENGSIGIKAGLNLPRMMYVDNPSLAQLKQSLVLTPMGGVFFEIPAGEIFVIAPEFMYIQRGTKVKYEHFSGSKITYSMNASYADFRLPFEFRWPIKKKMIQPFIFFGGEVGMRLFGKIHIDRTAPVELSQSIDVGDANLNLLHAGAFAGIGVRSRLDRMILKFSASYHAGFIDSYSQMEHNGTANPVNVNAYQISGFRLPHGVEITLGVAIPFDKKADDACSTFAKDRYGRRGGRSGIFGY